MKKALSLHLFFAITLLSCQNKHSRHRDGKPDPGSVKPGVVAAAPVEGPDSSLISLKRPGAAAVALEDVVGQEWSFDDVDKAHWNRIFWDTVEDVREYPGLSLFPDHRVTANARCGIEMGRWQLDKDRRLLKLDLDNGVTRTYTVRKIALRQMELGWEAGDGTAVIRCSSDALLHKRPSEDPFYPTNNLWRVRPGKAETREQLRQRARECVNFYALFFADNHSRQLSEISFSGLPSCMVWYNGAIGMQGRSELDKKWIACFFSSDQAYTAYDIIASQLEKHHLKWPEHPTSWVKQTGEVLMQLRDQL